MSQAIKVEYDNPQNSAIRWDFLGRWTWDDLHAGLQQSLRLRAEVSDKAIVPIILNMEHGAPVPAGIFPNARAAMERIDPRDYVIVAHGSGYMRSLAEVFRLLNPTYRDRVLIADSVEAARQIINGSQPV